ncbi:hypothetical protein CHISP_2658 [Chitinispirillum alkaliphilum]|nr:hypothetical protein CHISP_2658 [Chitinispirillum alkaliphilum]
MKTIPFDYVKLVFITAERSGSSDEARQLPQVVLLLSMKRKVSAIFLKSLEIKAASSGY